MRIRFWSLTALLLTAGLADAKIIDVNLNLSALPNTSTYSLVFALIDGSGAGDANNTVAITNPLAGGLPGWGGNLLAYDFALVDTAFYNEASVTGFTPSISQSFRVTTTSNPESGDWPDSFAFWMVRDSDGAIIPTAAPDGVSLLTFDINALGSVIQTYASDPEQYPFLSLTAPGVTIHPEAPAEVPEPSSLSLLVATGIGMALVWRSRRAR